MPPPRNIRVGTWDGSTQEEIDNEPDWSSGHNHRVGFQSNTGRMAGFTHEGDHLQEEEQDEEFTEEARKKWEDMRKRAQKGELINFQDVMHGQSDFHRERPEVFPPGWRFMVLESEDWIKNKQEWPANIKAREKREAEEKKREEKKQNQDPDDEDNWRRGRGEKSEKHNNAYGKGDDKDSGYETAESSDGEKDSKPQKSEYQKLREKYSPQEISLLRSLENEDVYMSSLEQNDGTHESPVKQQCEEAPQTIDMQDQFTPDNWIPRSQSLVRLTGQHPLNAEPKLSALFDAGLITPNKLHYVRNHAAVPRLFWETHVLDVENGKLMLSMDKLQDDFKPINIPVALACDGNRRGELNMIKKSKGFTWGSGAISCAYWKGAQLQDVLAAAGVPEVSPPGKRMWVNFEGADEPSEGKYATSIPLDYAMGRGNDVLLAYEMNDVKLPPDHGYPVRLLIPGYVGGRCIKWLARIWTSEKENDSHYHIWDNRVLPSFVVEKDGNFARTMFHHPSTACNEQNLNSIIVKPAQGEKVNIPEMLKQVTYRVAGIAYDGGGHEVQRVELSLDDGETWLYCVRKFPERPVRNGNKFWTWTHWHIDIDTAHFVEAKSLTVRCFNVFKNSQPRTPVWNTMGMMNNGWHKVKPTLEQGQCLVWRHPVDTVDNEGWMTPSTENQLAAAKQSLGTPDKQFTRREIEKHSSQDDCWLVINNNVYDATSVLDWHPGGKASLLAYAGKLTSEATSNFESIHDEYAHSKLAECAIGKVTDKAANFMKEQAKAAIEETAKSSGADGKLLLQKTGWTSVTLKDRKQLSEDTYAYTFQIPDDKKLNLGICKHIKMGFHMKDRMLIRPYTPTKPILESDVDGTFELTVKTYLPNDQQPGGAFSNFLLTVPLGQNVDVNGPTGEIEYLGNGKFNIEGEEKTFSKVSLIVGGSGLTPAYQLLVKVLKGEGDKTQLRVVDANKSEADILLRESLDELAKKHKDRFEITHVLSHPSDKWEGTKGHVNEEIIKKACFAPGEGNACFLCGPPAMIQKAALPALKDWGYEEEKNVWGF